MRLIDLLLIFLLITTQQVYGEELTVYRQLPFQVPALPDDALASDPIIGRLACPPMIQYNLLKQNFSSNLFAKIAFSKVKKTWNLMIGDKSKWWSGEVVSADDIAKYLNNYLPNILKSEHHLTSVDFSVKATDATNIRVNYKSEEFPGPYMLSGHPLTRIKDGQFECVGDYSLSNRDNRPIMIRRPHAKDYRYEKINLLSDVAKELDQKGHWFRARQQLPEIDAKECARTIDYSIFTQIVWNTTIKPSDSLQVRSILDGILPRAHLINHILRGQANAVTGPWIKVHPGYDRNLRFTSIDSKMMRDQLKSLLNPEQRSLDICIKDKTPLIENLLKNAFESHGLQVAFKYDTKNPLKECHGSVELFDSIWPEYKHIYSWLSRKEWGVATEELQSFGIKYLKTMSYGEPNFDFLRQIHQKLFNQKLVSVLMQHKACIDVGKGFKEQLPSLVMRDLAWFEKLIRD